MVGKCLTYKRKSDMANQALHQTPESHAGPAGAGAGAGVLIVDLHHPRRIMICHLKYPRKWYHLLSL